MSQEEALRFRFAQMETDALLAMWQTQEREAWAEAILRSELKGRGLSESAMDEAAERRAELQAQLSEKMLASDTFIGYGLLGRIGAIFGAIAAGNIVGGLIGRRIGLLASILVLLAYVVFLVRRLLLHSKQPISATVSVGLAWQWIEAGVISLVVVSGFYWVATGTNV